MLPSSSGWYLILCASCFGIVLSFQRRPRSFVWHVSPFSDASWHFCLTWFRPFVQLIQAGSCFDMVLSIQSMPGGSCKVCQMALVLICFDPIMQHMPNGRWYGFIYSNFSLCHVALAFSHSPNAKWHLLQWFFILPVFSHSAYANCLTMFIYCQCIIRFYMISLVFGLGKKAPSFITTGLVEFLSCLVGNGFWRNSD